MNSPAPVVSVVVATRNRLNLLRQTLLTIRQQTLLEFECHVIDDGSRADVLAGYDALWTELDDRFQHELPGIPDARGTGPAAARNRGIRRARGEFVAFCDDDDLWRKTDYLEAGVSLLREQDADLFIANMQGEDDGRVIIPNWFPNCPRMTAGPVVRDHPRVHLLRLGDLMGSMRHHYPHPNGCIIRRQLLDEVGVFWERIDYGEDIDLIMRLADRARRILYRPDPVVGFNCTKRDSAYSRTVILDRCLQSIALAQHVRALCREGVVRRTARAIESWYQRQLADELLGEGRCSAAAMAAWQAFCVYPSVGGSWFLARTVSRSLWGRRTRPLS